MQSVLPTIVSFLEQRNARRIPFVSSTWMQAIGENDRNMIEGLWRAYPARSTYGSLILAIQRGDVLRVSSFIDNYVSYVPLRWLHILNRMLWKDIPVIPATQVIAEKVFERVLQELRGRSVDFIDVLRLFAFKFETPSLILEIRSLDPSDYPYDEYQETEEYARVSPNLASIVSNRIQTYDDAPFELGQTILWSLLHNRVDVLQYIYDRDEDVAVSAIEDVLASETSIVLPRETFEWLMDHVNLVGEYVVGSQNSSILSTSPETYASILDEMQKDNPLFWSAIAGAILDDVPEILEMYIISEEDAERALTEVRDINPVSKVGLFFIYEWYEFRRELLHMRPE